MNYYEDKNESNQIDMDRVDEDYYCYLLDTYQSVFFELEGVSRVLGSEHPLTKLMANAVDSLDREELEVAQAAFDKLPEHVWHRIEYPWIGHPPPPGTRQKLREEVAPELIGESVGLEPVGCYLQIDAREGIRECPYWPADKDGHVVDPALVYDLRVHKDWPIRVQIIEGSDKEVVLELLKKVSERIDQDWDQLTNPDLYLKEPDKPLGW